MASPIKVVTTETEDGPQYHARIHGRNGEPMFWEENHPDPADAVAAIAYLSELFSSGHVPEIEWVDEREEPTS